jgi:hypothetical protein
MKYYYDEHAEDQVTDVMHPWGSRIDLGDHIAEEDEPAPVLPKGYSFQCPEGCGECKALAFQFYGYSSWNTKTLEFEGGRYHKVYAADCCPESRNPIEVWNDITDEDMGDLDGFLKKNDCKVLS